MAGRDSCALKPLSTALHELRIRSSAEDFELDATYFLNVVAIGK
jgi:hypothetical protein